MEYLFEWDPAKAAANIKNHGVTFERAATVFLDPLALSVYDIDHSVSEDRWLTLGIASTGTLLVVHHTFRSDGEIQAAVRIISARRATKSETQEYGG